MTFSYYCLVRDVETSANNTPNLSSESYFHIKIFYYHLHSFSHPRLGCRQVRYDNFDLLVPSERLLLPESGVAIMRETFSRCRIIHSNVIDRIVPPTFAFAAEIAANVENAGGFVVTLEIDVLAASTLYSGGQDQELDRAVREWLEERESMEDRAMDGAITESMEDGVMNCGLVPATKDSVEELETVTYEELQDTRKEDLCGVCLDDFLETREKGFRRMPCSHVYHEDCIFHWLQTSHRCPLCRHELPTMKEVSQE